MHFGSSEDVFKPQLLSGSFLLLLAEEPKISGYALPSTFECSFVLSDSTRYRMTTPISIQIVIFIISVERNQFLGVLLVC